MAAPMSDLDSPPSPPAGPRQDSLVGQTVVALVAIASVLGIVSVNGLLPGRTTVPAATATSALQPAAAPPPVNPQNNR